MAALSYHARQRAIEYGANPEKISDIVNRFAPRHCDSAVYIGPKRDTGSAIIAIVRDGTTVRTVLNFYRKPTVKNLSVDMLVNFPKE